MEKNNSDISVLCNVEISNYANLKFLIDTGATSSVIKYGQIQKGTKVVKDDTKFYGLVKDQYIKALGKVQTKISIDGQTPLSHVFYIIPDDTNLSYDGMIGADFLRTFNARIDYMYNELKLQFRMQFQPYTKNENEINKKVEKLSSYMCEAGTMESGNSCDAKENKKFPILHTNM